MSKSKRPVGTPVPIKFKKIMRADFFRKFTWKERLQILLGYRAVITFRVMTEHSPGRFQTECNLSTTGNTEAANEIQNPLAQ